MPSSRGKTDLHISILLDRAEQVGGQEAEVLLEIHNFVDLQTPPRSNFLSWDVSTLWISSSGSTTTVDRNRIKAHGTLYSFSGGRLQFERSTTISLGASHKVT